MSGVPSTGQKLNLSANSSRQVEHCFIFILLSRQRELNRWEDISLLATSLKIYRWGLGLAGVRSQTLSPNRIILLFTEAGTPMAQRTFLAALWMQSRAKRLTRAASGI
jgi:hypothetical protein